MLFFDVAFFRFWSPFGEVLDSKKAAKIAVWAPKCRGASPFEAIETPWLSKMVSWGGPKSIFEPTGVDFGWFRLDFFKIWHCFWRCFLTFSHKVSNFHFLVDHCFDCPDVRPWSKQCLKFEQSGFSYFLGGKVYRGLKLCPTSPFIVKLRSQVGLGGSAKRKQCAGVPSGSKTRVVGRSLGSPKGLLFSSRRNWSGSPHARRQKKYGPFWS